MRYKKQSVDKYKKLLKKSNDKEYNNEEVIELKHGLIYLGRALTRYYQLTNKQ